MRALVWHALQEQPQSHRQGTSLRAERVQQDRARLEAARPWACQESCVEGHTLARQGRGGRMTIRDEIIDELLSGQDPQAVFAKDGLLDALEGTGGASAERRTGPSPSGGTRPGRLRGPTQHRNGHSRKTVLSGSGKLELAVPRDRQASFEPQLIAKYRRRFPDFDAKVISLYARGLSMREIEGHLRDLYGIDVSAELISTVTDAVHEQVAEWQNRPLDAALRPGVLRRTASEGARRRHGAQQGGLSRSRRPSGWDQGGARAVDRADRRREVLAAGGLSGIVCGGSVSVEPSTQR